MRAGRLDRLGVYANVAARFAEIVVPNDDRVGMIVFADRPLAICPPDRGLPAVTRIRKTLAQLSVQSAESDPLAAAVRIRSMLQHRGLVVLLTDLDDASVADQLVRAVKLLSPPHLVVVAGIHSPGISELAHGEARDSWRRSCRGWLWRLKSTRHERSRNVRGFGSSARPSLRPPRKVQLEQKVLVAVRVAQAIAADLRRRNPNSQPFNRAIMNSQ